MNDFYPYQINIGKQHNNSTYVIKGGFKMEISNTHYEYYVIEGQFGKTGRWSANHEFIYMGLGKEYEFNKFTASGECWQQTGNHGVFDKEYAIDICDKLNVMCEYGNGIPYYTGFGYTRRQYDSIVEFRVLKIEKSCAVTLVTE